MHEKVGDGCAYCGDLDCYLIKFNNESFLICIFCESEYLKGPNYGG